ncbi:hypothetical protein AMTR_s00018p00034170 [Amborella trichopoda]|uniref:Uncharacterized protein n=1 Tax=Amborella trichopoda TaxID=13333 RepID=W1PKB4_AMBTC|nr:hypothetical protein AMTR_s00018p00034170 [Amborella trichopoda]
MVWVAKKKAGNSNSSASLSVIGVSGLGNISFENFEGDMAVSLLDKGKRVKEDYNGIVGIEGALDFVGRKCVDYDIVKPTKVTDELVCSGDNQGKVFKEDGKRNMIDWIKISDMRQWDNLVGLKSCQLKDPGFCGGVKSSSGSSGGHDSPTSDLMVADPKLCAVVWLLLFVDKNCVRQFPNQFWATIPEKYQSFGNMPHGSQISVDLKVPLEEQGLPLVVTKYDFKVAMAVNNKILVGGIDAPFLDLPLLAETHSEDVSDSLAENVMGMRALVNLVDGGVVVNISNIENFDHSGVAENLVHFGVEENLVDVDVMENYDCAGVRDITLDDSDAQSIDTKSVMGASFNVPDAVVVELFRDRVKFVMESDI